MDVDSRRLTSYRLYYNNSVDMQKWSVDEGTPSSEITVMGFNIAGCVVSSGVQSSSQPKGWALITCSRMYIKNGVAIFEP